MSALPLVSVSLNSSSELLKRPQEPERSKKAPYARSDQRQTTGDDIPDEVWRLIASYLTPVEISRCIALNSTFLNLVLDAKYWEVRWTKLDKDLVNLLERLRDPMISGRVRKVYIRAWFIEFLLRRNALFKITTSGDNASIFSLASIVDFFRPSKPKALNLVGARQLAHANSLSPKQIIQNMITAVEGMRSVTEFDFEWRDLPLNQDTRAFLTSTRQAFSHSLRKLVLRAQIAKFKELLAITDFPSIDEVDFHFDCRTSGFTDGELVSDSQGLIGTVVPFIEQRKASLRYLSIASLSTVDLSEFFNKLPSLPNLRRVRVSICFAKEHLSDPSGVLRLLAIHSSSLLHVQLQPMAPQIMFYNQQPLPQKKKATWEAINARLLTNPACFSNLQSLEIPFMSIQKTLPIIKRSCDTLTSLCLTETFLSSNEVDSLFDLLSPRAFEMQHLHLEVVNLRYPLLHTVASRFPHLYSLILVHSRHLGSRESMFYQTLSDDQPIPAYFPLSAALADWKLKDIGIYHERYLPPTADSQIMSGVAEQTDRNIMQIISIVLPGIIFFKGLPMVPVRHGSRIYSSRSAS